MPASSTLTRSRRRTRVEQAEFYEQIVQISLQLFSDGGYDAISMRRLASEVGIAPMSLYRYFPTKVHLIRHIWDDVLRHAYECAIRPLGSTQAPLERLRRFLDAYMQYWLDHVDHYWVVFAIRDNLCDLRVEENAHAIGPNPQRFVRALGDLFDACVPGGRLTPAKRQLAIDMLCCKVFGFLLGTIGLASLRWSDVPSLKTRLLDDMIEQVRGTSTALVRRPSARTTAPGSAR